MRSPKPLQSEIVVIAVSVVLGLAVAIGPLWLSLSLVAILIGAGMIVWDFESAILAFIATRPLVDMVVSERVGPLSAGQLWSGLLIVLILTFLASRRGLARAVRQCALPFALVGGYALFTLWRGDSSLAAMQTVKLTQLAAVFAFATYVAEQGDRSQLRIMRTGWWMAIILVLTVAVRVRSGSFGASYYYGDYVTDAQGPHGVALSAVLLLPMVLGATRLRMGTLMRALLSIALVAVVVASLVRSALVALLVFGIGWLLVSPEAKAALGVRMRRFGIAVAVVIAVLLQSGSLLSDRLTDIALLTAGGGAEIAAGSGRIGIWSAVLSTVSRSWSILFYGAGPSASYEVSRAVWGSSVYSHNDFLEFLITGGLPLLGIYIAFLLWGSAIPRRGLPRLRQAPQAPFLGVAVYSASALAAFVTMSFLNGAVFYPAAIILALMLGGTSGAVYSRSLDTFEGVIELADRTDTGETT